VIFVTPSPDGGLYVLDKPNGKTAGGGWAWRGTKAELCLDSVETLGENVAPERWGKLLDAFAARLEEARTDVSALTVGKGGGTANSLSGLFLEKSAAPAVPRDCAPYDAFEQYIVWKAPPAPR
jgi:hypothetical protein